MANVVVSEDTTISEPIKLSEFLVEWQNATAEYDFDSKHPTPLFDEYLMTEMNILPEMVADLEAECRPETLISTDPKECLRLLHRIPSDTELATLQIQREEIERRKVNPIYKNKMLDKMKYRSRDGPWKHYSNNKEPQNPNGALAQTPDVLLTVQIYRTYTRKKPLLVEQEFEVLGQQNLSSLRDCIYCLSDLVPLGDFSQNPDLPVQTRAKDKYKSGFFFIEGTFYNDMRNPLNHDYSRVILDWARDRPNRVGPFCSESMESTQFIDLTIRLGQPYLYMHQGDCEHLVIFTDIRVLHSDDCAYLDPYPIRTYKSRERRPKCRVCQLHLAKWVTYGSQLTPEDPCFFCDTCYRALHFNNEGEVIVKQVRVYPYPDVKNVASDADGRTQASI